MGARGKNVIEPVLRDACWSFIIESP
jgi:hypothetical protein